MEIPDWAAWKEAGRTVRAVRGIRSELSAAGGEAERDVKACAWGTERLVEPGEARKMQGDIPE